MSDDTQHDDESDVQDEGTVEETADTEVSPPEPVLDPLEAVTLERDQLRDQMLRLHAEMENSRKRLMRDRDEERKFSVLAIARDLLPSIDNLHRAIEAGEKSDESSGELLQGVKMVASQLEEVLTRHGVVPIPAMGEPFDPNFHEALQQVPSSDHPPMTVIQEYERGFKLHERVIRPSKVIVSTAAEG